MRGGGGGGLSSTTRASSRTPTAAHTFGFGDAFNTCTLMVSLKHVEGQIWTTDVDSKQGYDSLIATHQATLWGDAESGGGWVLGGAADRSASREEAVRIVPALIQSVCSMALTRGLSTQIMPAHTRCQTWAKSVHSTPRASV
jgi:hypothetical protein